MSVVEPVTVKVWQRGTFAPVFLRPTIPWDVLASLRFFLKERYCFFDSLE
jgi:hypothetical protein